MAIQSIPLSQALQTRVLAATIPALAREIHQSQVQQPSSTAYTLLSNVINQSRSAYSTRGNIGLAGKSHASEATRKSLEALYGDTIPDEITEAPQYVASKTDLQFNYLLTKARPAYLTRENVYQYYTLPPKLIPHAYDSFYTRLSEQSDAMSSADDYIWQDPPRANHGARTLQQEQAYTFTNQVLYRPVTWQLTQAIEARQVPQIYLDGPTGSGKSIVLASLAAIFRDKGWLVLYIPDAGTLTRGGLINQNADGLYDTPWSAKNILKSFKESHGAILKDEWCNVSKVHGHNLFDLCVAGLNARDHQVPCQVVQQLVEELGTQRERKALILVDNYSMLFYKTMYGFWTHKKAFRQEIYPWQLSLVRAMSVLSNPATSATCIGASTNARMSGEALRARSSIVSRKNRVGLATTARRMVIPRYDMYELQAVLDFYGYCGALSMLTSWETVNRIAMMTGRDGFLVRSMTHMLLEESGQHLLPMSAAQIRKAVGVEGGDGGEGVQSDGWGEQSDGQGAQLDGQGAQPDGQGAQTDGQGVQQDGQGWGLNGATWSTGALEIAAYRGGIPPRGWCAGPSVAESAEGESVEGSGVSLQRVPIPVKLFKDEIDWLPHNAPNAAAA